jgi:thiol-disulfide isomerase/thioredoxin
VGRFLPLLFLFRLSGCGACDAFDPVDQPVRSIPIETLDGAPVDLAALRGQPLVVHFWLPSCHVCAREVPALMEASRTEAGRAARFLAVSIDPDVPSIRSRARTLGMDLPLYVARGEVLGPMHVGDAPSTVFVDRDGVIRAAVNGARDAAFLGRRLRDITQ